MFKIFGLRAGRLDLRSVSVVQGSLCSETYPSRFDSLGGDLLSVPIAFLFAMMEQLTKSVVREGVLRVMV